MNAAREALTRAVNNAIANGAPVYVEQRAFRQGSTLAALRAFTFKPGGKGRAVNVRAGDRFWVTNSLTDQAARKVVLIERNGRGHIGGGYAFTPALIVEHFSEVTP